MDINLDPFSIGRMYEATHAKLKRVSENSCFYSYRVVGYYELYTPFPIKGEVVHQGGETLLIWRIPIGSTLFLALCILGLFQLTISRVILNDLVSSLPLFLVGLLGVCALVLFSIQLEQKRARLALFELTSFSLPK